MTQWKEIQRNILVFTTPIYITVITQTTVLRFVIHVLCLWGHVEKNFSCNWAISNSSRDYDGKVQSIHFIFLTHIDQTNLSSLNWKYFYLWNCFDICILTCAVKLKGMASTINPSKKIQMPLHQPKINMCFETMEFMISLHSSCALCPLKAST